MLQRQRSEMTIRTDVLIVGAGLAGLRLANLLSARGIDFLVLEARDRTGGRIRTDIVDGAGFDMGPAWFWTHQPRIKRLINELRLGVFEQHGSGKTCFEDEAGSVHNYPDQGMMRGSFRVEGGLSKLTSGMARKLHKDSVLLRHCLTELKFTADCVQASVKTESGTADIEAKRVVLALPPRVVASKISFLPALPEVSVAAAKGVATWMAGQAKFMAVYEQPFWRDEGFSGDAMSRRGPLAEIHDASPASGGPYALFGFVGVPPAARSGQAGLCVAAVDQLVRIFGPHAGETLVTRLVDWAAEPETATDLDKQPIYSHPHYGMPQALTRLYENRLFFGSTETASDFGGYLEGALESAENANRWINGNRW